MGLPFSREDTNILDNPYLPYLGLIYRRQCTLSVVSGLWRSLRARSEPKLLSRYSLALTLMQSVGSILFRSGSCSVASAARPRLECRMSVMEI